MNHADTAHLLPSQPLSPSTRVVCRVAPIEAKWVHQTDERNLRATAALRSTGPAVLGQIAAAEHDLHEQLQRYATVHREHLGLGLRDFHPMVRQSLYWLVLLAAALLESPVNKAAMSFLAMSDEGTWAVAGFISALNVLGASYCGKTLRQVGCSLSRDWFVLGGVGVVSVWLMTSLAGMRADHIALQAAADGMPVSDWALSTLLSIQALFFAVGSALSFSMVPADARWHRVLKDKSKLRRGIDRLLRRRTSLAARHDQLWLKAQQAIGENQAHCQALVGEYRDENFSARTNVHPLPTWLRQPVDTAVFAPVDLGPRVLSNMPTLEQLLARVEAQADEGWSADEASMLTQSLAGEQAASGSSLSGGSLSGRSLSGGSSSDAPRAG